MSTPLYGDSIAARIRSLRTKASQAGASTRFESVTRRELVVVVVVAAALCAAVYGPYVAAGGRYLDDWWLAAYTRFPRQLGFSSGYDYLRFYSGARPGAVVYWLVTYWLFGLHYAWHRALGVALTAGLTAVFFLLLRELRFGRRDAAAITALSLVLPVADSIHFWTTPDVGQLCVGTAVGGMLLAVRGLRASGRRALVLNVAACCLYALSMLIAETMVPIIGLTVLIYRTQVSWRRAASRWAPDAVLAAAASLHYLSGGSQHVAGGGTAAFLDHAGRLGDQALTLLAGTTMPLAHSRTWVLIALLAVCAWIVTRAQQGRASPSQTRWLRTAGLAALFAAVSYVIYIPSNSSYEPLVPTVGNRINIGLLLPLSVLAFAIARLVGGLVPWRRAAGALTIALFGLALVGALWRLEADRVLWQKAATEQARVLDTLHRVLPRPPRGTSMLVFGAPGVVTRFERVGVASVNASVPVFSTWWELDAAVRLSYGRADLNAYPIWAFQPAQLACAPYGIYQLGLDGVRHILAYGHVYVVDVAKPNAAKVSDQRECERIISRDRTIRYDLPE